MVGSIFSRRTRKKLFGVISVILLFLSIFHFLSFTPIYSSTDSAQVVVSSVSPSYYIESMQNHFFQDTDALIQFKKIFRLEIVLNFPLVLLGRASIKNHQTRDAEKEIPVNRSILKHAIDQYPGITLREIQRVTGLAIGVIQYHLKYLEATGIETFKLGRCKHFFSSQNHFSSKEKMWLAVLQNKNVRTILQFIKSNSKVCFQKDIVNFTGINKVMVSYYVKQLEKFGILDRNHRQLQIAEDYIPITDRFQNLNNL